MADFLQNSDAFVWSIESDARLRSTIVTLVVLDRTPDWPELVNRFEQLARRVPVFRQRVITSPAPLPPRWDSDPEFDLSYHLRRVTASAPGTVDTLLEMARIAAVADFDRTRPLWEVTLIDGLSDGGAALLCKLHHALTDGVGAVELGAILYDDTERYETCQVRDMPAPVPCTARGWWQGGLWDGTGLAAGAVSAVWNAARATVASGIRQPVGTMTSAYDTTASIYRTMRPMAQPGSPIMLVRSRSRRLAIHDVPKDTLHRAGGVAGGTVNDAFLAAVAGGLRRYHEKHGVTVGDLTVTMPISIRTADDPPGGNRATLMRFGVPAGIVDPADRIRVIHDRAGEVRHEKSLAHTELIAGGLNLAPLWYVSSVLRNVDFVASDVPGIPIPVFLAGARVRSQYAFSPTIGAAFNITLLSYVDTCAMGINADTGAIPDFDVFLDCLLAGFDEVLALAG
ncbi:wax ester/triacylglycerol synthase domain-containing protein [Mycobacterium sp. NPDC050551]|uniref:wax ester/triacylglycerol synthase domain-containing protein n=1 Tax=Mycobacterium sp. NPDC050551 TaxID=3155407 RepID=UPI0034266DE6